MADQPPKLLCILGTSRSGSTYLCATLANQPGIDSRLEIFNPHQSNFMRTDELLELSRRSGETFAPCSEDPAAVRTVRQHPTLVLDCLADLLPQEKRLLTFKVLRRQLSLQQVRDEIIARPDTAIVFLRRRPIDVFISSRKATHLRRWSGVDTTDLKIDIDARDFMKWWHRTADWYWRLEKACWKRGKPFYRLTYEEDIDVAPHRLLEGLRPLLKRCGVSDLTGPPVGPMRFTRQDRTPEVAQRVGNWPAFQKDLVATGENRKAFSPFPHFEPTWRDRRRRFVRKLRRRLWLLVGKRADR